MSTLSIEGGREWMWLPDLVLYSVLSNLVSADYVRFSCVCKRWHSVATDQLPRHNATLHKRLPFHLKPPANYGDKLWSLYSITQDKLLEFEFKLEIPDGWICGSSRGWLASSDYDERITLYNPFTRARISLPPFPEEDVKDFCVLNVILSADPSFYPADCIVAARIINFTLGYSILALTRPGRDEEKWTHIAQRVDAAVNFGKPWFTIADAMFDKSGKWVYATGLCGTLGRANIENFSDRLEWEMMVDSPGRDSRVRTQYLVEGSNGDVLVVWPPFNCPPKVFKIQGSKVVEVDDLNGSSVIVGRNSYEFSGRFSIAVEPRDFPNMEADCVYCWSSFLWKFDVKLPKKTISHRLASKGNSTWILPTINLKSPQV